MELEVLVLHRYTLWECINYEKAYLDQFSYSTRKFFQIVEFLGGMGWEVEVSYMQPEYIVVVRRYGIIKVAKAETPSEALVEASLAAVRAYREWEGRV